MKCDVLLVTVTDVETQAVLDAARLRTNRDYNAMPGRHKTYFDLGVIGGSHVFLARSEMGSAGIGASLVTITDAIAEVRPTSVIMVGIAFGVDPKKQKIGEILVSKQLQPYELQKVGTTETGAPKIVWRGDRAHCSERRWARFWWRLPAASLGFA